MRRQVSPSTGRAYGLARVARIWGIARATVYRQRRPANQPPRRPGPQGPMPDAVLVEAIHAVLAGRGFSGEGYRKAWARLRCSGIRSSRRRDGRRRVPSAEAGAWPAGASAAWRGTRAQEPHGTSTTARVDVRWGTDLTYGVEAGFVISDGQNAQLRGHWAA
jgi:putative transposase